MTMHIEREKPVAGGTFWLFQYWDTLGSSNTVENNSRDEVEP